jgi:hypothetical protein
VVPRGGAEVVPRGAAGWRRGGAGVAPVAMPRPIGSSHNEHSGESQASKERILPPVKSGPAVTQEAERP